jgi:hypothetical protein
MSTWAAADDSLIRIVADWWLFRFPTICLYTISFAEKKFNYSTDYLFKLFMWYDICLEELTRVSAYWLITVS